MNPFYSSDNRQELCSPATRRRPLRVNNVARRLRKNERTIRHLAFTKRIPAFKINRKSWGFWPEDVEQYRSVLEIRNADR